ncbi:hypothetical protein ANANG_G00030280 [Anguilla anguilla]|uniref:Uncharacterized protein n=1 Tax=Anguilla anguilla TaxID=7936 RepID=A0A9D3MRP0_ANGAN|nr:hypothetical protein ANANG_G00030280 [Anguilla anguilla]
MRFYFSLQAAEPKTKVPESAKPSPSPPQPADPSASPPVPAASGSGNGKRAPGSAPQQQQQQQQPTAAPRYPPERCPRVSASTSTSSY